MRYLLGAVIVAGILGVIIALPGGGDLPDPKWGPFRGRVVDADTGRPIVGATALVVWLWTPPGRSAPSFYDSRAAVTASDGQFEVPKRTPTLLGPLIDDPLIEYGAPGYALTRVVTAADGLEVAHLTRLDRLTASELSRHRVRRGHAGWIPDGARNALMQVVNGERRRLGLGPVDGFQLAADSERPEPRR